MTNDYIRREDAVNTVIPAIVDVADVENVEGPIYMIEPADVAPVVRCKDCHCHGTCTHEQYLGLDGFCSHGERREE